MKRLILEIKDNNNVALCSFDEEIVSVSFGALDRGNVSDITNWGCFSNTGDVEFIDKDNRFEQSIADNADAKVCIYCITTTQTNTSKELLATFLVEDYEIDRETKKVSVILKDALADFQTQSVDEYYELGTESGGTYAGRDMDTIWYEHYSEFSKVTDSASALMKETVINIPYIEKGTVWQHIDKFCQATMMRCFCNKYGKPTIADETIVRFVTDNPDFNPTIYPDPDPVKIRARNILSIENKTSNNKTKIGETRLSAYNYTIRLNQPITNDASFSWYYEKGLTYGEYDGLSTPFVWVSWAETNSGVVTTLLRDGTTHTNTSVRYDAHLKDHIFEAHEADITVSVSSNLKNPKLPVDYIFKKTLSTNTSEEEEIYSPSSAQISFSRGTAKNSKRAIINLTEFQHSYPGVALKSDLEAAFFRVITGGTLNWLGDFFTEDGVQNFGSENAYAPQLQSNELIQVESTFGKQPLAQHIIDTVTKKYSNGVECVVMEVTPSTYQTKGGATVDRLFEKYEEVIPYVVRNGVEQPYSTNEDGSEKIFKIMGIEYSYRGLLRQKLHLQELV